MPVEPKPSEVLAEFSETWTPSMEIKGSTDLSSSQVSVKSNAKSLKKTLM